MAPLPAYDPSAWHLAEHGDSRQRRWAPRVCSLCPAYEPFWQKHIVPLTFRPHDSRNYFVRPKQKKHLLALADTSYALFLHLTGMLRWSDPLLALGGDSKEEPGSISKGSASSAAGEGSSSAREGGGSRAKERPGSSTRGEPASASKGSAGSATGKHSSSATRGTSDSLADPLDLCSPDRDAPFRPTDCLYYFFSHTYSLLEAAGTFAEAVNRTLEKYGEDPIFPVDRDTKKSSWYFRQRRSRLAAPSVAGSWHALASMSKVYRNALVHERPLLMQSGYLPAPREDAVRELSGLVAISRMALNERTIFELCERVEEVIQPIVKTGVELADLLWEDASEALDAIDSVKYPEDQLRLRPEESHLTLEKILAARQR